MMTRGELEVIYFPPTDPPSLPPQPWAETDVALTAKHSGDDQ